MREVLYRGKRVDNGEWVYGSYYHCCGTAYGATFIVVNDFGFIEVIPHTVGQYTGLTDKNGKKIFEGDICGCFCNTQVFIVEYCKDRCGYFFDDCIKSGGCDPAPECLGNLRDTIEVIGNIYDNPDLLKGINE